MAPERKLSDSELGRLRALGEDEGWTHADLGACFGISPQYVGRLLRGEQRATIAGLDAETLQDGVLGAVDAFLGDLRLTRSDDVLAAMARAFAGKLDACAVSDSATAAQAVPRLSAELTEVLERLRLRTQEPREPDAVDALRRRHEARRLAAAVVPNDIRDREQADGF